MEIEDSPPPYQASNDWTDYSNVSPWEEFTAQLEKDVKDLAVHVESESKVWNRIKLFQCIGCIIHA